MENYTNIAKLSYTINCVNKTTESNPCIVYYDKCNDNIADIISGEITCGISRKKWKLYVIEDQSNWICHCISGNTNDKFSFDIEPNKQYRLKFVCQKGCCLYIDNSSQKRISQIGFKQV